VKPRRARRQRGAALLALLAVVVLGASWALVSRLNAASADYATARRLHNAKVLNQAKQALIGYVAAQAAKANEANPGALPCPENPGDFDSTTGRQGVAGTNCGLLSAQKVGRLPWKTLGLDRLVDADGEPLWYVVSRNWGADINGRSRINSASAGLLTLDGVPAVALIIAPGAAFSPQAAPGCAAWSQRRPSSGTPDWRNYLECENAGSPADAVFVASGPAGSFNDQVLALSAAELLPAIEAAIGDRIQREISPLLAGTFTAANGWVTGRERVFPFAAAFADPASASFHGAPPQAQGLLPFSFGDACNPASELRCLPLTFSPSPPGAYAAGGAGYIQTQACGWDPADATAALCEGEYHEDSANPGGPGMRIEMSATVSNVAKGFRVLDARVEARDDVPPGAWQKQALDVTATTMNLDGSATIRFGARLPNIDAMGWGTYASYRVRLKVADHPILATRPRAVDFKWGGAEILIGQTVTGAVSGASGRVSKVAVAAGAWGAATQAGQASGTISFYSVNGSFAADEELRVAGAPSARSTAGDAETDAAISWFARNEWYRHIYYAVAPGYLWSGPGTCSDLPAVTCLQVANLPVAADATKQRALLVLMGRTLSSQARPSANLADYLDSSENRNGDSIFEQRRVNAASNDRFISLSRNP
jgi:hypothetical protein